MQIFLLTIVAVVAFTTVAVGESCMCNFTGQVSGTVTYNTESPHHGVFQTGFNVRINFEMDFDLKKARIYTVHDKSNQQLVVSDFFQDLATDMIYRVPYVYRFPDKVNRPNDVDLVKHRTCLSMKMTEAFRFPTYVPSGLGTPKVKNNKRLYEYNPDTLTYDGYTLDGTSGCKLAELLIYKRQSTKSRAATRLDLTVTDNKLINTFGDDFSADTQNCRMATDMDEFFADNFYFYDEDM